MGYPLKEKITLYYHEFERFIVHPVKGYLLPEGSATVEFNDIPAMVFLGAEDFPILPGMNYYFRHYSKPSKNDEPYTLTKDDIGIGEYLLQTRITGNCRVDFKCDVWFKQLQYKRRV